MKFISKRKLFTFFFLLCFTCTFISTSYGKELIETNTENQTDSFDIKNSNFLLPQASPAGNYSSSLFLYNIFIPPDWTLDVIKTPMICYAGKYTLPQGFNVQASLATLIISYRLSLGPFWNYSINNFHCGVGYQVVWNYGTLNQKGYATTLTGWEQQPSVAFGYSFKKMAVSLRGDLYVNNSFYVAEGENTIPYTEGFLNGFSVTTSIEQRLSKNHVMSVGLKWNYIRYHVVAWPAFPVNQYYYNVPEFQLGYEF